MTDYNRLQTYVVAEAIRIRKMAAAVIPEYVGGRLSYDHWDLPHSDEIVAELVRQIERRDPGVKWPGHT